MSKIALRILWRGQIHTTLAVSRAENCVDARSRSENHDETKNFHARYANGVNTTTNTKTNQRTIGLRCDDDAGADANSRTFSTGSTTAFGTDAATIGASALASTCGGATVDALGTSIACRHVLQITVIPASKSGDAWIAWQPEH